MNFFTVLKQDHQEAKEAFQLLLSREDRDHAGVNVLCENLLLHMALEETYFYPVMKELPETRQIAEESILEHQEAKKAIRDLLGGKLEDVEFKTKLELLRLEIEHHVREEEREFFPKAEKLLSEEQIQTMTDEMLRLKRKGLKEVDAKMKA